MTPQEIVKRNGYIAFYIGGYVAPADKLRYHTSWRWLMPVIERLWDSGVKLNSWTWEVGEGELDVVEYGCVVERHEVYGVTSSIEIVWEAVTDYLAEQAMNPARGRLSHTGQPHRIVTVTNH
jgi:hypothetical protein